jgi:hypothetical protein
MIRLLRALPAGLLLLAFLAGGKLQARPTAAVDLRLLDAARPSGTLRVLQALPDPGREILPASVLAGDWDERFGPLASVPEEPRWHWIRLVLDNGTQETEWRVSLGNFDWMEGFQMVDGRLVVQRNGLSLPTRDRACLGERDLLPLHLAAGARTVAYFRVHTLDAGTPPKVFLVARPLQESQFLRSNLELAFILGVLLVMAGYNASIGIFLRGRAYGHYALFLGGQALYFLVIYRQDWLPPSMNLRWDLALAVPLACWLFFNFSRHYLEAPERFPTWNRVLWAFSFATPILSLPEPLLPDSWHRALVTWTNLAVVLSDGILVAFAVHALRKGFRPARYYFYANMAFFTFVLLWTTGPAFLGWLDLGWLSAHALKVGIVVQVILFSFALGGRFRMLQEDKANQERDRILAVAEMTERKNLELEQKVQDRTQELALSYRKLAEAQEQLGRLEESSRDILDDIPGWAGTMAEELQAGLGLPELGVFELVDGTLETLHGAPGLGLPDPSWMRGGTLSSHGSVLIPAKGMTGDTLGLVQVRAWAPGQESTERPVLEGFASRLGNALEMARARTRLAKAELRRAATLGELHARGMEALKVCPRCGECFPEAALRCPRDDRELEMPPGLASTILDRYKLTRRLGQGSMGTVYEALDEKLARPVALKLMRPENFLDPGARRRFEREGRTLVQVNHPGVVTLHDQGELEDGTHYIVMERLYGMDLAALLRAFGPGTPDQVASLLLQGAEALDSAHRLGIVHRDIKPQNLFLGPAPEGFQVKILDFGLAKSLQTDVKLTRTGQMMGTPTYMAPEQVLGYEVDERSDTFSLATVLFEALTGSLPHRGGPTMAETFEGILRAPATRPSTLLKGLPEGLDALFEAALAKNPEARPRDILPWAREVAHLLASYPSAFPGWPVPLPRDLPRDLEAGSAGDEPTWNSSALPADLRATRWPAV